MAMCTRSDEEKGGILCPRWASPISYLLSPISYLLYAISYPPTLTPTRFPTPNPPNPHIFHFPRRVFIFIFPTSDPSPPVHALPFIVHALTSIAHRLPL